MRLLYTFTLLASTLLIATSCHKLDSKTISDSNDLIQGTWNLTKVKNNVTQDGILANNDVSNNFEGWTFEFRPDNSAHLNIPSENLSLEGYWEMYETYDQDSEGSQTSKMNLYMYFDNPDSLDQYREFTWFNMKIKKDTFKAEEIRYLSDNKVYYKYELSR